MATLNLTDIREVLSSTVRELKTGIERPQTANATTSAVSTLLRSVKLEMEYMRLTGREPNIDIMEPNGERRKAAK